ncbi:hypothetical protein MJO28_013214 [Puccinia striiformis f. sp. tritici]|uniref:Uncharacterized protein n=1 Tax=Puccinia striiformis f. sp. tritici TaxID=168172 RepID=A0ACC0DXY9_9BASI|nr:hypothetical protein MJO28_013214 [Puccinia striiformis f. sp. tritici]
MSTNSERLTALITKAKPLTVADIHATGLVNSLPVDWQPCISSFMNNNDLNPAWNGSFNNTELDPPNVQNSIFLVYQLVKDGVMKTVTGQAHHNSISQSVQEAPNNLSVSPSGYEPEFNSLRNSDVLLASSSTSLLKVVKCSSVIQINLECLRLTTQASTAPSNVFKPPTSRYTMNIFSPVTSTSSRCPKNESIEIQMKTYYSDTSTILKENSLALSDVPVTFRLRFPNVVYPDDSRNEIYIKLWSGDFSNLNEKIVVAAALRTNTGLVLERVISRGSGEPKVTRYNSMVYRNNHTPTWGELMKLDISSETIEISQSDKPFAFSYLPLFSANRTFIPDGEHNLILFIYDEQSATPEVYSRVRPTFVPGQLIPGVTLALSKLLIPLKDSFVVRSFLCSTLHTQDEILLRLMKWNTLLDDPDVLRQTLTKLKFASEVEICSLAQEHDNIRYPLGLLPKLLESYPEFESPTNVEFVQRLGTTASVISSVPIVFPATYVFSLLNSLPPKPNLNPSYTSNDPNNNSNVGQQNNSPPTVQNALEEIAVVMITMVMLAPTRMLKNHLELMLEVEGKVILKLLELVSKILQREFIPTSKINDLKRLKEHMDLSRSDFFVLNHGLLSSKLLIIEECPSQKPWESIGDFTISIGLNNHSTLSLINDINLDRTNESNVDQITSNSEKLTDHQIQINEVTRCGGYQVQFVPGYIEPLLELCLSHHDELRSNTVIVVCIHPSQFSAQTSRLAEKKTVIVSEFNLNRDFTVIADEIIDKLDNLLGTAPHENLTNQVDEMSRASFVGQLRVLFNQSPVINKQKFDQDQQDNSLSSSNQPGRIELELKAQVNIFLESRSQFLDLLLSIRNLPPGDEFIDNRVIGTLKLMLFIRNIGRSGIYIHYVHKLVNFHAAHGNFVEAGLPLRLHADSHEWDLNSIVEPMPELSLPKQTVFARKETLYFRILDFLSKGKAWESGIQICKELQEQYEHVTFDYKRLSEVLAHQSSLFLKIVKTDRYFSEYFRVAFYGQGFPPSVQNCQFVYRGYEWEKYAAFCDRMHNKHPNAQIFQSQSVSTNELEYAEGQYLQITRAIAEPDRTTVVFKNPEVSSSVVSYYEHNATNTFSHSKPFNKDNVDISDTVRMWVEKTFLLCKDVSPTVLERSEILEIRVLEISAIENAIMIAEQKTRELEIDTPAKTGIPAFRNGSVLLPSYNVCRITLARLFCFLALNRIVFLSTSYLAEHPSQQHPVQMLRKSCLSSRYYVPTVVFVKNFKQEIRRLPLSSSLNPGLLESQQEALEDKQGDRDQQPQQNEGYSSSRSHSSLNERQAIPTIFPVSTSERHTRILRDRDHASVVGSTIAELIRHQLSFTKMVLDATITYPNESDHIRKAVGINAGQVVNIQMKSCPEGIPPPTDIKGSTPSFPLLPTLLKSMVHNGVHCQDFINLGVVDLLLGLLRFLSIPYGFATTPAAQAFSSITRVVTEILSEEKLLVVMKRLRSNLIEKVRDAKNGSDDLYAQSHYLNQHLKPVNVNGVLGTLNIFIVEPFAPRYDGVDIGDVDAKAAKITVLVDGDLPDRAQLKDSLLAAVPTHRQNTL